MKILAWEASMGGKSENCLAWEAPIGSIVEHDGFDRFYGAKSVKSAHTALAVKACLLGGNSYTKCSMTFVNIAVAISALAGEGQKRFRTETRIRWCFRHFSRIFGCLSARGY